MKKYIIGILALLFISCNPAPSDEFGADSIVQRYGGKCTYSIGFYSSTKTKNKRYVEITLDNSDALQRFVNDPDMPASNIAYLSYLQYKNSNKSLDFLRVVLNFKNSTPKTFEFDREHLDVILSKINILNQVINLIKNKNFSSLEKMMDDKSNFNYDRHLIIQSIKGKDKALGNVKRFISVGFLFYTRNQQELLHISGIVERTLINHQLSIDVDTTPGMDKILNLQFAF